MKKIIVLIFLLLAIMGLSNTQINGNFETSWTYTMESSPAQFYENGLKLDLYIKPDGSDFSGSLNLNKGDDDKYYITDGEFDFKFGSNLFKTLWKKKSVNTTDWINAFNNEKIGAVDGLVLKYDLPIGNTENFLFKKDGGSSSFFISHIRGIPLGNFYYSFIYSKEYYTKYNYINWRFYDYNLNLGKTQFFGEFGYSYDKDKFYLEDNYLLFWGNRVNLGRISNAIFLKYLAPAFNKTYLPDSFYNNIRNELTLNKVGINFDFDYYFKNNKISVENFSLSQLKGYFNYNNYNYLYIGIPVVNDKYNLNDLEWTINLPFDLPLFGKLNLSVYKKGIEDDWTNIKKYGDFSFSSNLKGNLLGYYYDISYIFGNRDVNIENSTVYGGGFSEVLYGTLSKSFGNLNLFGKGMYIYGVIERYKTMYLEAKYTGFSNMELLLGIGDGNFGASKEFKKQLSLTVKTGF
ncbi:hypothetical protein XO12_08320 [Marinitoga sp. 1154]|uniref:hypothetical protein n=1 Tax=Marinitoga sp. 1154 TaxID=1643335 RepID=UPI001586395D|nr:hypothetical protein [Marinitoga sp. 1154]NUV00091.1 hypothetical protein [Marinitoga sp. 1154]